MTDERFPITDPETGEYLAGDAEEAAALVEQLGAELVAIERALARRPEVERMLGCLLDRERPWVGPGGWAVALKPSRRPPGRVIPHEIERHREALAPLGLGPRERTEVVVSYPKLSELTAADARAALARVGLAPETLIHRPDPGPDVVVVIAPERMEAGR